MWGSNSFFPFCSDGWFFGGGITGIFLSVVLILAFIFFLYWLVQSFGVRRDAKRYRDQNDSLEILNIKFANGEISAEEYLRMKEVVKS